MNLCHQCSTALRDDDRFCAACGSAVVAAGVPADSFVGRTFSGAYRVFELIGVGGMGRVYRAEQSTLGRTVAIKVIHPRLLADESSVARFYREARASSSLNHPNSVSIIDFGRTDDGVLYLVMEYLRGKDLSRLMVEEGPLPFTRICNILCGVLAALGEAHELGVIHRDLKPENIIVERLRSGTDLVKVVDFGLAKVLSPGSSSITAPNLVCGTPDYMAPEQGRGQSVDGRGDIYAVGVLLFEMLTGRLPFEADTPTMVVLKHITEPVPDPRRLCPHRDIPKPLIDVVFTALQKEADDRFQGAEQMSAALRSASALMQPLTGSEVRCPTCGARTPRRHRFCGECGAPVAPHQLEAGGGSLPQGPTSVRPRMSYVPRWRGTSGPLLGRDNEMRQVRELLATPPRGVSHLRLEGEPGVGKTRMLAEIAARAADEGCFVVGAGPHQSATLVPYEPVKNLLLVLVDGDDDSMESLPSEHSLPPLARAGLCELRCPSGLVGSERMSRAGAVAAALAEGLRIAGERTKVDRFVLLLDDLHRCDGLTGEVLLQLGRFIDDKFVLVVTAGPTPSGHAPEGSLRITLDGLLPDEALRLWSITQSAGSASMVEQAVEQALAAQPRLPPLYIEQLRELSATGTQSSDAVPPRLADVVAQRVERLDIASRRVLQAAAVLGVRCQRSALAQIVDRHDLSALGTLKTLRFVCMDDKDDEVSIAHPFIRDLVAASIPAQARRELHGRALQVAVDTGAPLEVRADHAFHADELMTALMLSERVGDEALRRGDPQSAILSFQRGLGLARREMLGLGDASFEAAIATFGRKLAIALEQTGDLVRADGVLRETLELVAPNSSQRARMLRVLGRIGVQRGRQREAGRRLGQALEIATANGDKIGQAEAQLELTKLRIASDDLDGADSGFQVACRLLHEAEAAPAQRGRALLEHAQFLCRHEQRSAARLVLERAQKLARGVGGSHLAARVSGLRAEVALSEHDVALAERCFSDAAALAAEAGDADGAERWHREALRLRDASRGSVNDGALAQKQP
ncbi:MAG: protein kinase [Proteobacteria bacterium]|nr:protein kinase [Pseudomonadota bacterium]